MLGRHCSRVRARRGVVGSVGRGSGDVGRARRVHPKSCAQRLRRRGGRRGGDGRGRRRVRLLLLLLLKLLLLLIPHEQRRQHLLMLLVTRLQVLQLLHALLLVQRNALLL